MVVVRAQSLLFPMTLSCFKPLSSFRFHLSILIFNTIFNREIIQLGNSTKNQKFQRNLAKGKGKGRGKERKTIKKRRTRKFMISTLLHIMFNITKT